MRRRSILWLVLLFTLGSLGFAFFAPIAFYQFKEGVRERWDFYRLGVHSFRQGEASGLTRSECPRGSAGCSCWILIHGAGDQAQTWKRMLLTEKDAGFSSGLSFFALNLGDRSPRETAQALVEFKRSARADECTRWSILANSRGGWVASWMLLLEPQSFRAAVLLSPAGFTAQNRPEPLFTDPTADTLQEFLNRAYAKPHPLPRHVLEAAATRIRQSIEARRGAPAIPSHERLDAQDFSSVTTDVTLIWGDRDRILPPSDADFFKKAFARSKGKFGFFSPTECGHLAHKECPETVWKAIQTLERARR